mmetsp:Transcript_38096/g.100634  ORF Transcript_38096/g.100634 Transcript_38096/m.100634 type:complete len:255 (+) Transcript_38096:124-888(+)
MPVELQLRCTCSGTKPGDLLVAVGSTPALGSWAPERSLAVLETSPATFPVWELSSPLLLLDQVCEAAEAVIEYKYVIIRSEPSGRCDWEILDQPACGGGPSEWEDLGAEFAPAPLAAEAGAPGSKEELGPLNRTLLLCGDCVVLRVEEFGLRRPAAASSWPVCANWGPGVVGGGTLLGCGKVRNSANPAYELLYRAPYRLFVEQRRPLLEQAVAELGQKVYLPPGLWGRIVNFADAALAASCFPVEWQGLAKLQ